MVMLGAFALCFHLLWSQWRSVPSAFWLLEPVLTAERLLPLIGAGMIIGQLEALRRIPAFLALALGTAAGFAFKEALITLLKALPGAPTHFFLVGPLACLLAGLILVLPPRLRFWPGLPLLLGLGALLALAADFSNPGLHDIRYPPLSVLAGLWLILIVALAASLFKQGWTGIASRIAGSWLLAIGALYGGAYMASRQTELTPPPFSQPVVSSEAFPGFAPVLKAFDRIGPQRPLFSNEQHP
ncbi:hypothetical protein [Rhizobium paknamense]|uniref:Uncharacterized protein n=1 Tax=Rhizobium paknamense TaxID=1206817 RepID=A0ABU0ILP6_9HYPH|nr:hypothetical protein [Rhizobium paknamense]MDQ0458109.1 hypothetical protein [Rhizobium paknamense]